MTQDVIYVEDTQVVVVDDTQVQIIEVGIQGPAGAQGPPGQSGAAYITYKADGALSGHRVVRPTNPSEVGYADSSVVADANAVLGITLGATLAGDDVNVQTAGEITEPSWTWVVGDPVFLGLTGLLTQTPPATGFSLVVGVPVAPTKLVIGIKQPIIL